MASPYILKTKIKPPRITGNVLFRPRVKNWLDDVFNFRLTLLQAGAGYGKSTTLAMLAEDYPNVIWYQLSEEDQDPTVFLLHLCHATQIVYQDLEGLPIQLLEMWESSRGPLRARDVVFQYLNAISSGVETQTLVIFDDLHMVSEISEIAYILDQLIGLAPSALHFVVSTRNVLQLPNLFRWRSLGQVLSLDQSVLTFSEEEIAELFKSHYGIYLSEDEIEDLFDATEGWAISLRLIGQSLKTGSIQSIQEAISRQDSPLDSLFEILAKDVLADQSEDMQKFMQGSSVLRVMTPDACDWLLSTDDSRDKLEFLHSNDLFVTDLGNWEYRYHPIFQQFLHQQLEPGERKILHALAAGFFKMNLQPGSAIYHYIKAEDYYHAADLLNSYGGQLYAMGHLDTLANYLGLLSPEILSQFPALIYYLGDLARLHSRFQEALGWYQQAEALWREGGQIDGISRALRGQARIYLDTVDPTRAEELLQEALRLSDRITDRETRARLYQLLAENKLNSGNVEEAEELRRQADVLRQEGPDDSQLWYRVLLRTGRLAEARSQLELQAQEESAEPVHLPRSHRETQLLLSIIYAMQGEAELAMHSSEVGIQRGKELVSPFVTAVGYMRKGHALMIQDGGEENPQAAGFFEQAISISEELSTPRLQVEALWGLTRLFGYKGDLDKALNLAKTGVELANQAGDEWIASLTRLAMGASYVIAGQYQSGANWLDEALRGFQECSDPFGATSARLWLSFAWFQQAEYDVLNPVFLNVINVCRQNGYDYLFTCKTLLGFPDERMIVPLLIWARENQLGGDYPQFLLEKMGLGNIISHPGYKLRVNTLGSFQVWRGRQQIGHGEWRREKTRHLFQLLIAYRQVPLDREQICEFLWPGTEPDAANRNFKVVLNTLYSVLEPQRNPGTESAYILREGSIYGLRPGSDFSLDIDLFEKLLNHAEDLLEHDMGGALKLYQRALELYRGEFLPEARYQEWTAVEREHLTVLFLRAADKFCELSLQKKNFNIVIEVCQRILSQDSCWERAYRHLMAAYDGLGDHGQVARTFRRCVEIMRVELNVNPSYETVSLYRKLTGEV